MSLWKFGSFEGEVDFMDADFLDRLFEAKRELGQQLKTVPNVGRVSDIIRAQCACYYTFFDNLFGDGAGKLIFDGKHSMALCVEASESIAACEKAQNEQYVQKADKYKVQQHGNRQQRRVYQKNQNRNQGKTYYGK